MYICLSLSLTYIYIYIHISHVCITYTICIGNTAKLNYMNTPSFEDLATMYHLYTVEVHIYIYIYIISI